MVLLSNNTRICSGSLVTTSCYDYEPNFLTAFHCIDVNPANGSLSSGEISQAENWVFRFRYESTSCSSNIEPSDYVSYSGADFIAGWRTSDFALMRLNQLPDGQRGIYISGWSRNTNPPAPLATIHHPSGDLKKISIDNNSPVSNGYLGASGNNHWRVNWESGSTEGGSSGSPLLDNNQRIIGQLHGGYAACGNDLDDWYGRFDVSWNGGDQNGNGTVESSERLRDWLSNDPNVMTTNTIRVPYVTTGNGDNFLCSSEESFYLWDAPSSQTHNNTWIVPSNVQIVSSSYSSIRIKHKSGSAGGSGTITARLTPKATNCSRVANFSRTLQVGTFSTSQISFSGTAGVCPGYEYTYTANVPGGYNSAYSYSWTYPSGWVKVSQVANQIRLRVPTYNAQYGTVRVSITSVCGSSNFTGITVYPGYSCGGSLIAGNFSIYPNPADEQLTITQDTEQGAASASDYSNFKVSLADASFGHEPFSIVLYNAAQEIVARTVSKNGKIILDTSELPAGKYFLHIFHQKAILQRQIYVK